MNSRVELCSVSEAVLLIYDIVLVSKDHGNITKKWTDRRLSDEQGIEFWMRELDHQ